MKKRLMVRVMAYFLSAMMCVCLLYGNETGVKAAVKPKLSSRKKTNLQGCRQTIQSG